MVSRLFPWIVLLMMFCIIGYTHSLAAIFMLGVWISGATNWWMYITCFLGLALLTVFLPKLRHVALLSAAPLSLVVLTKALYYSWLGHFFVFSNDILLYGITCYVVYLVIAFQIYHWGFELKHIGILTVWLIIGLIPISYQFAEHTREISPPIHVVQSFH